MWGRAAYERPWLPASVDRLIFGQPDAVRTPHEAMERFIPYVELAGIVLGGWQMARAAQIAVAKIAAGDADAAFYEAKLVTARFFADHILSKATSLRDAIVEGSDAVMALEEAQF